MTPFGERRRKDGFTIDDRDEIIPRFHEYEREIEGGSYELYAEVLRRVAVRIAKDIGWPLEPSRAGFLPDSVQRWPPFKETNPQLKKFGDKFQTGLISNIDDKLLGPDAPPHPARLRPRRHRPAGALLQARPGALQRVRAAHRHEEGLGAHRGELLPRRRAVPEGEDPGRSGSTATRRSSTPARRSPRPRSRPSSRRPSCSARRSARDAGRQRPR